MEAAVDEVVDELIANAESSISQLADQIAWRHAASASTTQTEGPQGSLLRPLLDFGGPDARLTSLWQSDGNEGTARVPQPAGGPLVSMHSSQGRALPKRLSEVDLVVTELVVEASTAPSAAAAGADQRTALGASQAEPLAKQDSAWSDAPSSKHAADSPACGEDSLLPAHSGMSARLESTSPSALPASGAAARQWQRTVSSGTGTAQQSVRHQQQQQRVDSPAAGLDRASASMLLDVDVEPEAAFAAASALEQGQLRAGPSRVDAGTGPDPGQRRRSKLQVQLPSCLCLNIFVLAELCVGLHRMLSLLVPASCCAAAVQSLRFANVCCLDHCPCLRQIDISAMLRLAPSQSPIAAPAYRPCKPGGWRLWRQSSPSRHQTSPAKYSIIILIPCLRTRTAAVLLVACLLRPAA